MQMLMFLICKLRHLLHKRYIWLKENFQNIHFNIHLRCLHQYKL